MSTKTKGVLPSHPSPPHGCKATPDVTKGEETQEAQGQRFQEHTLPEPGATMSGRMELSAHMSMAPATNGGKRRCSRPCLGDIHEDMLERVLARLPPASFFRLRAVCREWRAVAASATFLDACARVPPRDPWFLMLSERPHPVVAFDTDGRSWNACRAPTGSMPVAASGGLVLYSVLATGALCVSNPLTGASRALPTPPQGQGQGVPQLHAIAMYGSPYRVALFTGELPDLSMAVFDSSEGSWEGPVPLARRSGTSSTDAPTHGGDDTVYFLSKSGDVVATNMKRSSLKQYSSAVVPSECGAVVYFLSHSGTVLACDTASRTFAELPRILPVHFEYSIDVVACNGASYAVVLSEYLDTASLRVWQFAEGAWRQVAAMPPGMAHGFYGKRADINCVGHGDRVMVCVSSGEVNGCFMCDVRSNQWEELPRCINGDGEIIDFLAAFSFEPRVEINV
ncbi:F-box only protein 13-like [Triticum urartu]|uniref:F-box domain-containing protein n=1 Tax=Triticum urartu TaxID=4572 RepID=A0A8R7QBC8_TRIUA|nr:F-box only protein 13-like [Triticum urartu]